MNKLIHYFRDTISEFKKLHFPSKREVYITTLIIIVTITIFSLIVMFADFVIAKIIGLIFGL